MADHVWDLRNPDGAMTGMPWGRALLAARDRVLAHSLPEKVDIEVRTTDGRRVATAEGLSDPSASTPMARLELRGDGTISRRGVWPDESDVGTPVILPGGEVGVLLSWWNEPDGSAWRWQVEFANRRG